MIVLPHIVLIACARLQSPQESAPARPTVVVRQSAPADVVGDDDRAIEQALVRLGAGGGTVVLGPGRYAMRRQLIVRPGLTLRGEPGAVLALPAPVLTAEAAPKGAQELVVAGAHEFAGDVKVQILPPVESRTFADGATERIELVEVERVEGQKLFLKNPLALDIPAASRVGYPHKILWLNKEGGVTIEDLAFEGGRVDSIPMPGHSQRCAIWASAPFGFEEEPKGPPGKDVHVRRCSFRDFYGRAVAFYNHVDGSVEDCTVERVADEAIDLDHYVERFRITNNTVTDAQFGIVLNDASRNVVEGNRIQGCDIGIFSWWYEKTPRHRINEENVIRANEVRGSRVPIQVDKTCVRYVIEKNRVEGKIVVVEPENTVRDNTSL